MAKNPKVACYATLGPALEKFRQVLEKDFIVDDFDFDTESDSSDHFLACNLIGHVKVRPKEEK